MSFESLGLSAELLRALDEQGYTTPTPIQQKAIPVILAVITVTFFLVRIAPGGPFSAEKAVLPEVKAALEAGRHVVTANKALIALHANEIFAAAQAKGVTVAFEAAVAGGIPIIKARARGPSRQPDRMACRHYQWHR